MIESEGPLSAMDFFEVDKVHKSNQKNKICTLNSNQEVNVAAGRILNQINKTPINILPLLMRPIKQLFFPPGSFENKVKVLVFVFCFRRPLWALGAQL